MARLGEQERSLYRDQGYVLVRGLFAKDEVAAWNERFLAIARGEVEPAAGMLVMRDVMVARGAVKAASRLAEIAKVQDFHGDPVLFEHYCRHPVLLDHVEELIGSPDLKSVHTMLINKPPGVDGRHPLHQDLLYFPFRPADLVVGTWTAMEPCTRANGCLVVVPGSHRGGLLQHENVDWEWVNAFYLGARGVGAHAERLHLEMEPGDCVLFHPLLLHGSGRNRTEGYRRAISCHYASAACRYNNEISARPENARPYVTVRGVAHEGCI